MSQYYLSPSITYSMNIVARYKHSKDFELVYFILPTKVKILKFKHEPVQNRFSKYTILGAENKMKKGFLFFVRFFQSYSYEVLWQIFGNLFTYPYLKLYVSF